MSKTLFFFLGGGGGGAGGGTPWHQHICILTHKICVLDGQ